MPGNPSSFEREQPMTVAPARSSSCAMPTPTPRLVPVTIAILPSSAPMSERRNTVAVRVKGTQRRGQRQMQRVDDAGFGVAHPGDRVDGAHARGEQALIAGVLVRTEADFEFGIEAGLTVDDDAPDAVDATGAALRPVRREVLGHPVDVLDGDHFLSVDNTDALRIGGAYSAGFDDATSCFKPSRRGQEFAGLPDLL